MKKEETEQREEARQAEKKPVKNPWRFAYLAAAVYGGIKLLAVLGLYIVRLLSERGMMLASFVVTENDAASVGIIGGADGPTAIFLTSQPVHLTTWLLPLLLVIVGIVGYRKLGGHRQKT